MHINLLDRGKGYKKLQKDYDAFGKENFYYEILEVVNDDNKMKEQEDFYIDKYDSVYKGYNTKRNIPFITKSVTVPLSEDDYNFINDYFGNNSTHKTKFLRELVEKELERIRHYVQQ